MTAPSGPAPAGVPAVHCRSLGVSFGAVRALHDVSLDLAAGRIHALVGQNGAGKTTLAKVLGGLQTPDSGTVSIAGREIPHGDVRAAKAAGLAMVHQHFSLPPSFTVAEALELAAVRPGGRRVYRRADLHRRWQADVAELGGAATLSTRIRDLPVEARQSLEIVRALATEASVLLLDEPTALLTPAATDALFERLRRLRADGVTILVVLHKLREVAAVADTVSVLRDGELVLGPAEMSEVSQGQLSDAIVGSGAADAAPAGVSASGSGPDSPSGTATRSALLEMIGVSSADSAFEPGLAAIDLRVDSGEIVGIAGVEGNGQRSLVSVIAGLSPLTAGSVRIGDDEMSAAAPALRRIRGLRLVPFDRNTEGVSQSAPLWLNQSALRLIDRHARDVVYPPRRGIVHAVAPAGSERDDSKLRVGERLGVRWRQLSPLISLRQFKSQAATAMDRWRVRYDNVAQPAESLSGGNIQRLILSRELDSDLEVLVAAQPTRGLDFAATEFVRRSLRARRDDGAGVLLVSSDLDELFELSDRLAVMYGGRIVAHFDGPYDRRAVGDAMTGAVR
ncbi:MAG: ATP-binding cassette domain-containing protein [Acidimicrobiia bacterium]|nr:ATP-binding cassette domain-containing protein [Acidimicrobiia bacterium]